MCALVLALFLFFGWYEAIIDSVWDTSSSQCPVLRREGTFLHRNALTGPFSVVSFRPRQISASHRGCPCDALLKSPIETPDQN